MGVVSSFQTARGVVVCGWLTYIHTCLYFATFRGGRERFECMLYDVGFMFVWRKEGRTWRSLLLHLCLLHIPVVLSCLYKSHLSTYPLLNYTFHSIIYPLSKNKEKKKKKTMRKDHPVIIHQHHQTQLNPLPTSTMERRPTYEEDIKADDPSTLTPRDRTQSNATTSSSSSSYSSHSSSSTYAPSYIQPSPLSRRKLIRDRCMRPWQLMSLLTLRQDDTVVGRSGGLKSPYPTPGRRNYDRV